MVINLGDNYGPGALRKKDNTPKTPEAKISPELIKLIKIAIVLSVIIVVYLVLFSKIIDYRTETMLWSEVYNNFKEWKEGDVAIEPKNFTEKESALVVEPDMEFTKEMRGYILLQTEENGEAWYVNQKDNKKYFLGSPDKAYSVLRKLGESTTNSFIKKYTRYPVGTAGKVLLDAEDFGKSYYISPKTRLAFPLFNTEDTAKILREQGVGISNEDLRKIPVGDIESID